MTHACCTDCGLRFAGLPAPEVTTCPSCSRPVTHLPSSRAVGLRLAAMAAPALELDTALSAALVDPRRDHDHL